MSDVHTHTEQLYVKTTTDGKTGKVTIKSYCLSCGQKVYEVLQIP